MSIRKTCTAMVLGCVTMLALVLVLPIPSTAEITNVVISSTQSYGEFAIGKYKRMEGEAHGVLSPKSRFRTSTRRHGMLQVLWNIERLLR